MDESSIELLSNLQLTGMSYTKLVVEWNRTAYWTQAPPVYLLPSDRIYYNVKLDCDTRVSIVAERRSNQPANSWWDRVRPSSMPRLNGRLLVMRHWCAVNAGFVPKFSDLNIISETDDIKWPK